MTMKFPWDHQQRHGLSGGMAFWILACVLATGGAAHAGPTQSDVFKSIQDSVGPRHEMNSTPVILLAVGGGAVLLVLALMSRREQKQVVKPTTLNHVGKLAREILKEVNLKPAEMKQLKMLADSIRTDVGETPDPFTLLLCPSLLARSVNAGRAKIDRKAVAQVVKKMRLAEGAERE